VMVEPLSYILYKFCVAKKAHFKFT